MHQLWVTNNSSTALKNELKGLTVRYLSINLLTESTKPLVHFSQHLNYNYKYKMLLSHRKNNLLDIA